MPTPAKRLEAPVDWGSAAPGSPSVPAVAIVGGGCAGTLVAVQLLRLATGLLRVILIERSPPFGRGMAYNTECPQHLLNAPAARMSAFPEDPGHFLRWAQGLAGFLGYPETVAADDFVPRAMFGRYLGELLEEVRTRAGITAALETVGGEVVNLEEGAGGGPAHAGRRPYAGRERRRPRARQPPRGVPSGHSQPRRNSSGSKW